MWHYYGTVARDVNTAFLSPERPSHDTGGALKNRREQVKKKKKKEYEVFLALSRWHQLSERTH